MIRVILVEDSATVRDVWKQMLVDIPGISIIGEFSGASAAIEGIRRNTPDLVLLDVQLAEGKGMDVLRILTLEYPHIEVFVVTNFVESIYRQKYLAAGASAFYDKNRELSILCRALDAASQRRMIQHADTSKNKNLGLGVNAKGRSAFLT